VTWVLGGMNIENKAGCEWFRMPRALVRFVSAQSLQTWVFHLFDVNEHSDAYLRALKVSSCLSPQTL
jgi:hypothetical protein